MSALSIQPTFPIFTDTDGSPLENGYIWIGTVNLPAQTNPIAVYWDAALTITATQPIRTQGGYPSNAGTPGRLYVDVTSSYSILVQNKNGLLIYSAPAATEREIANNISYTPGPDSLLTATDVQAALDQLSDDEDGSSYVGFLQAGTNAVARTAQSKMRDVVSVKDFGAVGDGVTDDTTAWNNWLAAAGSKYIPAGSYLVSGVVKKYITPVFINSSDTNHSAGLYALEKITSGNANTAFGNLAGSAVTTGSQNTAVGKSALETMQAGNNNTAIGFAALRYANDATCIQNTIVGAFCGEQLTTGNNNTAIGHNTLKTLTTGDLNTAVGQGALAYNVVGNLNSAVGYHALLYYEGDHATAMGIEALMNCTTGAGNVAFGRGALKQVTTQTLNTAVGHLAGTSCSSSNNVFVGESAGWLTTTGSDNTVVGMNALVSNVTGEHNVAVGRGALLSNNNSRNVAVGRYAAISATSDENTAIGNNALYDCTTGRANTALGVGSLTGLSTFDNCTGLGAGTAVTGSNQVQLGDSSTTTYAYGAVQNRSDARDKADVRDTVLGLDFINALRPVDFRWDYREDYGWGEKDGSKKRARYHHGLIAQEVKSACDAAGVDFGGYQDHSIKGGNDVLSLGYEELIAPLIKAVQQLSAEVAALKAN